MANMTRRDFVKRTASTTAAVAVGMGMIGNKAWAGANDTIRAACVGVRGQGRSHIRSLQALDGVEVVALCDVDENVLADRLKDFETEGWKKPKTYVDIRKLLEDKDIDVVSMATPNHLHALHTIWACQAGKDVYVEKPASHNIWEGRKMVEAARKYNRMVQCGMQIRSSKAIQWAVEYMQSGALGEVYMAKGLCYKWRNTIEKAGGEQPIPKGVHYDLWLGPAPKKPLMRKRLHYDWHWLWDYGNGDIGNQGVHQMDVARWGLGLKLPVKVQSMGGHFMFDDDQETPNAQHAMFEYPVEKAGGDKKKLLQFEVRHWITNHEGGIGEGPSNTVGIIFYGSEGYLVVDSYNSWHTIMGKERTPGAKVMAGGNHFQNFIDAVRARDYKILNGDIEEGHLSSVLCHLAMTAYQLGRTLEFDPKKERYVDDDEANATVKRKYREPFVIPDEV